MHTSPTSQKRLMPNSTCHPSWAKDEAARPAWALRDMRIDDLPGLASLLPALGYPSSLPSLAQRWAWLSAVPDQRLLVAVALSGPEGAPSTSPTSPGLIGFCHLLGVRRMDSDGYAEVLSLVVEPAWQRQGIGRGLIEAARVAAMAMGHGRLRLGSGAHREDAHRFYEAQGFTRCRPGLVFEQRLSADGG